MLNIILPSAGDAGILLSGREGNTKVDDGLIVTFLVVTSSSNSKNSPLEPSSLVIFVLEPSIV